MSISRVFIVVVTNTTSMRTVTKFPQKGGVALVQLDIMAVWSTKLFWHWCYTVVRFRCISHHSSWHHKTRRMNKDTRNLKGTKPPLLTFKQQFVILTFQKDSINLFREELRVQTFTRHRGRKLKHCKRRKIDSVFVSLRELTDQSRTRRWKNNWADRSLFNSTGTHSVHKDTGRLPSALHI